MEFPKNITGENCARWDDCKGMIHLHCEDCPEYKAKIDMRAACSQEDISGDCEMCGEEPATVRILNPNNFPGNDWGEDNAEWTVCETCRRFVNGGMSFATKTMLDGLANRLEREKNV